MSEEHPVLFHAPAVRAVLNLKPNTWPAEPIDPAKRFVWQTRRACPQLGGSENWELSVIDGLVHAYIDGRWRPYLGRTGRPVRCPCGRPGDRLWIRESFSTRADGETIKVRYPADGPGGQVKFVSIEQAGRKYATDRYVTRRAYHMSRWASRILLELRSIEVERVEQINRVMFLLSFSRELRGHSAGAREERANAKG